MGLPFERETRRGFRMISDTERSYFWWEVRHMISQHLTWKDRVEAWRAVKGAAEPAEALPDWRRLGMLAVALYR